MKSIILIISLYFIFLCVFSISSNLNSFRKKITNYSHNQINKPLKKSNRKFKSIPRKKNKSTLKKKTKKTLFSMNNCKAKCKSNASCMKTCTKGNNSLSLIRKKKFYSRINKSITKKILDDSKVINHPPPSQNQNISKQKSTLSSNNLIKENPILDRSRTHLKEAELNGKTHVIPNKSYSNSKYNNEANKFNYKINSDRISSNNSISNNKKGNEYINNQEIRKLKYQIDQGKKFNAKFYLKSKVSQGKESTENNFPSKATKSYLNNIPRNSNTFKNQLTKYNKQKKSKYNNLFNKNKLNQARNDLIPFSQNNVDYPLYSFYIYHYNYFKKDLPPYYEYYITNSLPHVHSYGPLILNSGRKIRLNSFRKNLNLILFKLKKCQNGPEHYFTVRVRGKIFRIFLGDVNDFFNLQCLYMMKAVVSTGNLDYSIKVNVIFNNPSKSIYINGKEIIFNPLKKMDYVPENIEFTIRNDKIKIMNFDLKGLSIPSKSIIFYHKVNINNYDNLFKDLSREIPSGNILFIIDKLQRKSVEVFRNFLIKYKKMSSRLIKNLKYKNLFIFKQKNNNSRIRGRIPREF